MSCIGDSNKVASSHFLEPIRNRTYIRYDLCENILPYSIRQFSTPQNYSLLSLEAPSDFKMLIIPSLKFSSFPSIVLQLSGYPPVDWAPTFDSLITNMMSIVSEYALISTVEDWSLKYQSLEYDGCILQITLLLKIVVLDIVHACPVQRRTNLWADRRPWKSRQSAPEWYSVPNIAGRNLSAWLYRLNGLLEPAWQGPALYYSAAQLEFESDSWSFLEAHRKKTGSATNRRSLSVLLEQRVTAAETLQQRGPRRCDIVAALGWMAPSTADCVGPGVSRHRPNSSWQSINWKPSETPEPGTHVEVRTLRLLSFAIRMYPFQVLTQYLCQAICNRVPRDSSNRRLYEHGICIRHCQESNPQPVPSQARADPTRPQWRSSSWTEIAPWLSVWTLSV